MPRNKSEIVITAIIKYSKQDDFINQENKNEEKREMISPINLLDMYG